MKAPRPSRPSSGSSTPRTTSSASKSAAQKPKSTAQKKSTARASSSTSTKTKRIPATPRELRASTTVVSPADLADKTPPPPATVAARAQRLRVNARRVRRELKPTLRGTSPSPQQMPDQIGAIMGPYMLS